MNVFFVNLEGVRVIQFDGEAMTPEVYVELERELGATRPAGSWRR